MTNLTRFLVAFWLVAASCIGSPEPCKADTVVALHGDGEITSATVRLSDLFSGVPPVIDRDIAQAPAPGKTAVYDAPLLEKLADKYRLDWQSTSPTDHVALTVASMRITTDELRAAVIKKIQETGVHGDIDPTFDVHTLEIDLPVSQPHDFTIDNFDYDPVGKRFRCNIIAGTGASSVDVPAGGHAAIKRHVPVLARRLEGGTVLAMTDLDWATVPDEHVTQNVITSPDQLIGHELRHTVGDGDVIHTNDVMPARLVTRGSLVTLKIETPMMQLTAQGRALADGAEGETVRVTNTQSNRVVEGIVSGAGEVTVHAGQKMAAN